MMLGTSPGPQSSSDRRRFLRKLTGWGLAGCFLPQLRGDSPDALPNPVGYATISWPEKELVPALQTISTLGFKGAQFLGWVSETYGGSTITTLQGWLSDLSLLPVALSCSSVDLNPDHPEDESGKVRAYAEFFQNLGGHYLQVTDGGNPEHEYSAEVIRTLGARMNAYGKVAKDFGLTLGYHPHFGTTGETREGLGRVLDATDPAYVKLIADVGHLTLGGVDPTEVIRTYHERLIFTHFKDVRKDAADQARKDRHAVRGWDYQFCEIGEGVVDFPAILRAFREVNFRGWVIVELDGNKPRAGGPAESARINKQAIGKLGLSV